MQLSEFQITTTLSIEALAANTELAKQTQTRLVILGLLDPPIDGKFGQYSAQALKEFQSLMKISENAFGPQTSQALSEIKEAIPLKLGKDFASRIVKYMRQKGYFIALGKQQYNIVYIEGANADGVPNKDQINQWNDRRIVIEITAGVPQILGNWSATIEPGIPYTTNPINPKGAARIAFGQYKAWRVGMHGDADRHEALVQVAPLKVHRDLNKDGSRIGDAMDEGLFGINQHWGYDMKVVGKASAGCLVGQSRQEHRAFMQIIKQDRRYLLSNRYTFMTTVIPGDDLAKTVPV